MKADSTLSRGNAGPTTRHSPLTPQRSSLSTRYSLLAAALGALVLALFVVWEMRYASGFTDSHWGALGPHAGNDYDEGAYVISAQLLLKGYPLFHTVFSAQPAFFLPTLAAVIRAVGNPVVGGHAYEALSGLAALAGVFWMAWLAYRPLAAPLAAALLAVSPGFLLYGHAVEAEMPMLGLCTLAVAAAQTYYHTRWRAMAALSGLLFMAGTEIKLLSPVLALPLALLLLGGFWNGYRAGRPRRAIIADALTFALCLVVPALLVLALLSPSDQLRQVVTFHLAASRALHGNLADNAHELLVFLRYDPGLLLMAAAGIVMAMLGGYRRYLTLVYLLWFLVTLGFLWLYHPLLQHQFIPLLPPLALLGAALTEAVPRMRPAGAAQRNQAGTGGFQHMPNGRTWDGQDARAPREAGGPRFAPLAAAAVIAVAYLGILGFRTVPIDRHIFARPVEPHRALLIAWLDRHTRPGDFVVCDDPMIALEAHRLLPPGLEDPSMVRTIAGYLTPAEAEATTLRYRAAAIVASRPMFSIILPQYLAWAARQYRQVPSPVVGTELYLPRP